MGETDSAVSRRFGFIDWFRGAFGLLMLEGHTVRALLNPSLQAGAPYYYHEKLHSLTGPAFLFTSGVAFGFATLLRWDTYHKWSSKVARRMIRFSSLLALGYILHLPYLSVRRTLSQATPDQIVYLLSMDILQCIGFSGLLLQLLVMLAPNPRWFFRMTVAGAMMIGVTTPAVWALAPKLPFWLGTSVSGQWGSIFPLFPHAGFYLAGAAGGYLFVQVKQQASESRVVSSELRQNAWLAVVCLIVIALPLPLAYGKFTDIGPVYFFPRVAILALLMAMLFLAEQRYPLRLDWLALVGRESLTVYIAHLIILYGTPFNPDFNVAKLMGNQHGLAVVILILIFLTGTVVFTAYLWKRIKQDRDWKAKAVQLGVAGYLVYSFVAG